MKNENYIKKWLEGSLTEEERRDFEQSEDYKKLTSLSFSLKAFQAPEYDQDAEWKRLRASIPQQKARVINVNWTQQFIKVAAVLLIMASIFIYFFSNKSTTVTTLLAEKTTVLLPDSSLAILNAYSNITYDKRGWDKNREVVLNGEAFFQVAKGSRFTVMAGDGIVEVLGTEFNVKSRDEYFEVICYEGLVKVTKNQKSTELPAKHLFRSMNDITVIEKEEYNESPHLIAGESVFYSVPFEEVIKEFERQYDVAVSIPKLDLNQKFTGRFTHTDMELALKSITIPLDLSYQLTGEKEIVLTKEHN